MRLTTIPLNLYLATAAAWAEPVTLKGSDIQELLSDVVLSAEDNGKTVEQIFQKSGVTLYSVAGSQSQGFWRVEADKYCSQWQPNPSWSCYAVVRDGQAVTFVSSIGKHYEMNLPATP